MKLEKNYPKCFFEIQTNIFVWFYLLHSLDRIVMRSIICCSSDQKPISLNSDRTTRTGSIRHTNNHRLPCRYDYVNVDNMPDKTLLQKKSQPVCVTTWRERETSLLHGSFGNQRRQYRNLRNDKMTKMSNWLDSLSDVAYSSYMVGSFLTSIYVFFPSV